MGGIPRASLLAALLVVTAACAAPPVVVVAPAAPPSTNPTYLVEPRPTTARQVPAATEASRSATTPSSGDLGLARPISSPSCDGSYIVVLGSVVEAPYAAGVQSYLSAHPGSGYLRTDRSCSSLRSATAEGNPIYAVYYGSYPDRATACSQRAAVGGDAYVKVMDDTTPAGATQTCA